MKRRLLFGYQLLTGLSDTTTGLLLVFAPATTLRLMGVHVADSSLPFLSFIGAFVLSTGIACLYGGFLAMLPHSAPKLQAPKLQVVWLLTAITRSCVAFFVSSSILAGTLEPAWDTVAVTDGAFALLQFVGLAKGWLNHATT